MLSSQSAFSSQDVGSGGARESLLRLDTVRFAYPGGPTVVQDVSISVDEGEIVSLVGPSGCGKSTLLALIAKLLQPEAGRVAWDRAGVAAKQRLFTLVFQKDTLLPWLTVEKNVAFGLRYLPLSPAERKDRVTRLLRMVNLEDHRNAYPYHLSGGMRRRVALLVGVAPLPKLLLLDEPFSALDEPTRILIHREVQLLLKELGIATVLVTHDLSEAISLSESVYILTRSPTTVASRWKIAFDYPRDVVKMREETAYHDLYRALWHDLSRQIVARDDMPDGRPQEEQP